MKGWFNSLGARIFLVFALLMALSCLGIYALTSREFKTFYIQREKESLLQKDRILAPFFARLLLHKEDPQPWVKKMGDASGVRITLIAPGGKVLADSQHDPGTMENHWHRPEVQEALKKGVGASKRYSVTLNTHLLYVAIPIKDARGNLLGVLRLSYHLNSLKRPLFRLEKRILGGLFFLLLFASLLALFLSREVAKGVTQVASAAQALSQGDFQVRAPMSKVKELSILAGSFNSMADSIQKTFKQVQEEREKLNALISAIPDLVVATDKKGSILFANQAFKARYGKKPASIWESIRSPSLVDLFSRVWDEGKVRGEVALENSQYEVTALVIAPDREVLLLFHDVTEKARLDRMKTEFVANVSHELKTPLTVMKGYIETLEMARSLEEAKGFVEVVKRHTDRMTNLVSDLLLLSSLEEGKDYKKGKVDLREIALKVLEWARHQAREKGLQLKQKLPDEPVEVEGVAHLLEQLLTNLLSNAINYTDQGWVSFEMETTREQVQVIIQDTGMGIPREHLPRVFERFYRVDPSRSRASGGTGLGLAIVKHIVRFHGGTVELESREGEGTTITVILSLQHHSKSPGEP